MIWKPVPGYDGYYEASPEGEVRNAKTGRTKKATEYWRPRCKKVLLGLWLAKDGPQRWYTLHSIIALTFLGPRPRGHEVNHKDGDRRNNAVSNLEYLTPRENYDHAIASGFYKKGEENANAKLTANDVKEIRELLANGVWQKDIAKQFGVTQTMISRIHTGKAWL